MSARRPYFGIARKLESGRKDTGNKNSSRTAITNKAYS